MKPLLVALLCLVHASLSAAQEPAAQAPATTFLRRTFSDAAGEHRYSVYLPPDYTPSEQWPVILYLHGAGVSGAEGDWEAAHGLGAVLESGVQCPAIVVFPQCDPVDTPLLERWRAEGPDGRRALQILNEVEQTYSIDPQRRILTGWSMGGFGAWSLAVAQPEMWSAVVPVSGGGDIATAAQLTALPIWAIHGADDRAVLPQQSQTTVEAVNAAGGQAVLTVLPHVGHDAWKYAYSSQAVMDWMLNPSSVMPDSAQLLAESEELHDSGRAAALDGEFRPAVIMPRAVSVRLGNDALRTIGYGLPGAIQPDMLAGDIEDQHFTFTAAGETFEITQADLTYTAELKRIMIAAQQNGTIRVQIGLQPLALRIGETRIVGQEHQAVAGPVDVRLGLRRPVWIDLTLQPSLIDQQLQLTLRESRFDIQNDNWSVSAPEDVEVAGPDITPELVRIAIVGGLYLRRHDVEDCVQRAIPGLVAHVQERLRPIAVDRIVDAVWPMPVFKPRLQLQFEELLVDADGISVVAGIAAAPINIDLTPDEPRILTPLGPAVADLPQTRSLDISIAPGILEALSEMLVREHVARIDVRDMPEPEFASLGNRARMIEVCPDLQRFGEDIQLRTYLDVAAPFAVSRGDDPTSEVQLTAVGDGAAPPDALSAAIDAAAVSRDRSQISIRFQIPRLVVAVAMKERPESAAWSQYASFDVSLSQTATIRLARSEDHRRVVRVNWLADPIIAVQGGLVEPPLDANLEVDRDRLAAMIRECWAAWTKEATQTESEVPDLQLGDASLRMEALDWQGTQLVAGLASPPTQITNSGRGILRYEVRGPLTPWSRMLTLPPGETHAFDAPYPLSFRKQRDTTVRSIPVGSEFEYSAAP
jgi:poly(3-hydroxybutyrate) depolymerase